MNKSILNYIYLYLLLILVLISCETSSVETIDINNQHYPNGLDLMIEKTNKDSKSYGIITGHFYGNTHSYKYKVEIKQGDVVWNGGSSEPKSFTLCNDTIFLHYLKEKYISYQYIDSLNNDTINDSYYQTQEFYAKHVDNRYLFNKLGSDYWVDISKGHYLTKLNTCDEYSIPNDNELSVNLDSVLIN